MKLNTFLENYAGWNGKGKYYTITIPGRSGCVYLDSKKTSYLPFLINKQVYKINFNHDS